MVLRLQMFDYCTILSGHTWTKPYILRCNYYSLSIYSYHSISLPIKNSDRFFVFIGIILHVFLKDIRRYGIQAVEETTTLGELIQMKTKSATKILSHFVLCSFILRTKYNAPNKRSDCMNSVSASKSKTNKKPTHKKTIEIGFFSHTQAIKIDSNT